MPGSAFSLRFNIFTQGQQNLGPMAQGINDVMTAADTAARRGVVQLQSSLSKAMSEFPKAPGQIQSVARALNVMVRDASISTSSLKRLEGVTRSAARAHAEWKPILDDIVASAQNAGRNLSPLTAIQDENRLQAAELLKNFQDLIPAMDKLGKSGEFLKEVLGDQVVKGTDTASTVAKRGTEDFRQLIVSLGKYADGMGNFSETQLRKLQSAVSNSADTFGFTDDNIADLMKGLQGLSVGMIQAESQARALSSALLGDVNKAMQEQLSSIAKAPPALQAYQASLEKLSVGDITFERLTKTVKIAESAVFQLSKSGNTHAAEIVAKQIPALKGLIAEEQKLIDVRKAAEPVNFRGIERTQQQAKALQYMQSVFHGLMLGQSAATGNIRTLAFNMIFLGFSVMKVVMAVAALTMAMTVLVGGFAKAISAAKEFSNVRFGFERLTKSIHEGGVALQFTTDQSIRLGFAVEDLSEGLTHLYHEGLMNQENFRAISDLARGSGKSFQEAASMYASAIGRTRANLTALNDAGVHFLDAENEKYTAMGRNAAQMEANRRILERYGGAAKDYASHWEGALARIKAAFRATWATIGAPVLRDLITPALNILADLASKIYTVVRAFSLWAEQSGLWQSAVDAWRKAVDYLRPVLRDLWVIMQFLLIGALWTTIAAFKVLGVVAQVVARAITAVWQGIKNLLSSIKPLWDALRLLAQALKDLNFMGILTALKQLWDQLPPWFQGLLLAIGLLTAALMGSVAASLIKFIGGIIWKSLSALGLSFNWTALIGVILGIIVATLALGIATLWSHPELQQAWKDLLASIEADLTSGKFLTAFQKIAMALATGLVTGIIQLLFSPSDRAAMSKSIIDKLNEAMGSISKGDFGAAAKALVSALWDAIKANWSRILSAVLIAGLLVAIFGNPIIGILALAALLAVLPSGEKILDAITKDWVRTLTAVVLGALLGVIFGNPLIGIIAVTALFAILPSGEKILSFLTDDWKRTLTAVLLGALLGVIFGNPLIGIAATAGLLAVLPSSETMEGWLASLRQSISTGWQSLNEAFDEWREPIRVKFAEIWESITTWAVEKFAQIKAAIQTYIITPLGQAAQWVGAKFAEIYTWVSTQVQAIAQALDQHFLAPLRTVLGFINDHVMPLIGAFADVLYALQDVIAAVLGKAIEAFVALVTNVLWPAIRDNFQAIYDKISTVVGAIVGFFTETLIPAWKEVCDWIGEKLSAAIGLANEAIGFLTTFFTDLGTEVSTNVTPIFTALWEFLSTKVLPIFQDLYTFLKDSFLQAITDIKTFIVDFFSPALEVLRTSVLIPLRDLFVEIAGIFTGSFKSALDTIVGAWDTFGESLDKAAEFLGDVKDGLGGFAEKISSLKLPDWLQAHSPTPFEQGLKGIFETLSKSLLPTIGLFAGALSALARAFTSTWGGIQKALDAFWRAAVLVFDSLLLVLERTVPQALAETYDSFVRTFDSLGLYLSTQLADIRDGFAGVLREICDAVELALDAIDVDVRTVIEGIEAFLGITFADLSGSWTTFLDNLLDALTLHLDDVEESIHLSWESIEDFLKATLESLDLAFNAFCGDLETLITTSLESISTTITQAFDAILLALKGLLADLLTALTTEGPNLRDAIVSPIASALDDIRGLIESFKQVGKDIMEGVKGGIKDKAHSIADAAADAVRKAIDAARGAADAHSPARVPAREIGEPFAEGIVMGMENAMARLRTTAIPDIMANLTRASQVQAPSDLGLPAPPLESRRGSGDINISISIHDNVILDDQTVDALTSRIIDALSQKLMTQLNRDYQVGFVHVK